jgi:FkbM family methyltransferase
MRALYRRLRVGVRQLIGAEPIIRRELEVPLEYHGSFDCGWNIVSGALDKGSIVLDIGLGEDVSFSQSLIERFGLVVHGFDPTPRSIAYVRNLALPNLILHEFGIGVATGPAEFLLPNDAAHVSGSLIAEGHVGARRVQVALLSIADIFRQVPCMNVDLLKLDIEGAEYDLIASKEFADHADRIGMICIEFHHRWKSLGKEYTLRAVRTLRSLGFRCAWASSTTNEEFLFVRGT